MRAVNLLPRDLEDVKKGPSKPVVIGCVGAVLAASVLAMGYLNASSSVGKQTAALDQVQQQFAAIPPPPQPPATVTALPAERQQRVAALASALATRVAWDRVLREVSLVLPDDVWLTQLTGVTPTITSTPSAAGPAFHITGFTNSQAAVARLLARLTVIPELEGVMLNTATQTDPKVTRARSVVSFDISANLRTSTSTASTPAATS
jgi:Tfp pilus assembly protein PilN